MTTRGDDRPDVDALLRHAAAHDPPPVDLEARVRARRLDAAPEVRRRPVIAGRRWAAAGLAGGLAAAATLAMLVLPAGPGVPQERRSPLSPPPDGGPLTMAAPPAPRAMRAAPVSLASAADAPVVEAANATPIPLASSDPTITIVWLLPGDHDDHSEVH